MNVPEKVIDYYDSMSSPWTYLGHMRFLDLADRFRLDRSAQADGSAQSVVGFRRVAIETASAAASGLQASRAQAMARLLGLPCNIEPAHHPVADRRACYLVIAAHLEGLDWRALAHALLRAVWVQDRNIADHPTLEAIANECGMDGKALLATTERDSEGAVRGQHGGSDPHRRVRRTDLRLRRRAILGARTGCRCSSGASPRSWPTPSATVRSVPCIHRSGETPGHRNAARIAAANRKCSRKGVTSV